MAKAELCECDGGFAAAFVMPNSVAGSLILSATFEFAVSRAMLTFTRWDVLEESLLVSGRLIIGPTWE
jgi:hypothetical protein